MTQGLSLIAANGTDQLKQTIDIPQVTIQKMVDAMQLENNETILLGTAGLLSLRNRAGYMPETDPRGLETFLDPDTHHDPVAYSPEVIRALAQIYRGQYPQTYREWLHFVTLDDRTFPYEALPMILSLATRFPDTRRMTKRILGSRGRWLIEHITHRGWDWAKFIKPAKRPRLTKYTKLESRVIERLEAVRYRRITLEATYEMQMMTFPWSKNFSRVITETFKKSLQSGVQYQPADIRQRLDVIQWSIHPDQTRTISKAVADYNQYNEFATIREEFSHLMHFRQTLRRTFADKDT